MRLGYTPAQVDGMENWQVAALLGLDVEEDEREQSIAERMAAEQHTLAERARKIREMKGRTDSEDVDITDDVMRQMGIKVI